MGLPVYHLKNHSSQTLLQVYYPPIIPKFHIFHGSLIFKSPNPKPIVSKTDPLQFSDSAIAAAFGVSSWLEDHLCY